MYMHSHVSIANMQWQIPQHALNVGSMYFAQTASKEVNRSRVIVETLYFHSNGTVGWVFHEKYA